MYFTNIDNDELKQFKNQIIPYSFSMSLTSILTSSLFEVEEMGNNLYRLYPLFYCKEITSSNNDDRILDTKCIIAIKKTTETYYSFNNGTDTVYDFSNEKYYPNYNISDELSVDDFNRLVYLLRRSIKHYDNIKIQNGTVNSTFANYVFDLQDSTISDEGIIITPRTLSNICTCTLQAPTFHNSKYYLILKVKKINNINLETDDDYSIETSTIRVPLVRNVPVEIPLSNIELYNIIDFDAIIEIIHSEPIMLRSSSLNLNVNRSSIDIGGSVTLTIVYEAEDSLGGRLITFKANGNTIGTATTNNQGVATLNYTPSSIGSYNVVADYDNTIISNTVSVEVTKLTPGLVLESNTDSSVNGLSIDLTGDLKYNGTALVGKSIKIYDDDTLIDTVITDNNGVFETTVTAMGTDLSLKAVFEGDNTYLNVDSNIVTIIDVSSNYIEMNVTGSSFSSYNSTPFTKTGTLLIDWGDNTIEVLNGQMSHNYTTSGDYTVKVYGNIIGLNQNCFIQSTGLISISIPNSVTRLGEACFYGCTGLRSITIPNSVTSLGISCFSYCSGLTSISLPNNVTSLEDRCFWECTSLTSISIPSSVTRLGYHCFYGCTGLTAIELEWDSTNDIISYNSNWIDNCSNFSYFIIPEGTTSLYTAKSYPSNLLKEPFDGISLTSDKSILSYVDGDYAVLSAQLTNSGSAVSVNGETVSFEVRRVSDDSLVESLTADTDASGVATAYYYGKDTGDLYIQCSVNNIDSNQVNIEDCNYYADTTKIANWNNATDGTTQFKVSDYNIDLTDYSLTVKFNTIDAQIMIGNQNGWITGIAMNGKYFHYHASNGAVKSDTLSNPIPSDVWKILVEGTTISLYRNDVLTTIKTNCNINYAKNLRLYPQDKASSVDYVKIKTL